MTRSTAIVACLAVGVLWAVRSGLALAGPNFRNPVTAVDWLSVFSLSLALLAFVPGFLALGTIAEPTTWFRAAASGAAISSLIAFIGNIFDNAIHTRAGTVIWAIGEAGLFAALVALVFALLTERPRVLAGFAALTVVGIATVEIGGGLLVLATWGWLAARLAGRGSRE